MEVIPLKKTIKYQTLVDDLTKAIKKQATQNALGDSAEVLTRNILNDSEKEALEIRQKAQRYHDDMAASCRETF
jgi:hypothetical protein